MKNKLLFVTICLAAIIFIFTGCSSLDRPGFYDAISGGESKDISGEGEDPSDESGEDEEPKDESEDEEDNNKIQPGQLTAAEWNDNKNYSFWKTLFSGQDGEGIFKPYLQSIPFDSLHRITVNVTYQTEAVVNASVEIYNGQTKLYSARSDTRGNAYLFPKNISENASLTIKVSSAGIVKSKEIIYIADMDTVSIALDNAQIKSDKLEIMFVVDTTGSMSDELEYLKSEIKNVINRIKAGNPATEIHVALLFYRDKGDEYVTKYFEFSTDINKQQTNISAQHASGGGDFPEAVDTALYEAVSKQWSEDSSTKLIIHVLDAPPHSETTKMQKYVESVNIAAQKGIRMIPVASSGIDKATEYLLRNEAMLTGGTYIFLTDDSGIGGSHLQPTAGDYVIEYLDDLLVRVINEYHTGTATDPIPYNQQ